MSRIDDLRGIAGLLGIHTRHFDALGVLYEPDEEVLAQLIAAFGLPSDPAQAAEAIADLGRPGPFGLEPVQIVAAEDARPALKLQLPAGVTRIEWHCQLENGTRRSGHARPERAAVGQAALALPHELPLGYHELDLAAAGTTAHIRLIVAPAACYLPAGLQPGARSWGLTTQLYGLRGTGDWGIGDFTDLAELCRGAAALGAATVGLNPLHALFAAEPRHISPYSPSSRTFLDYLYIDATRVPGYAEDAAIRALAPPKAVTAVREIDLIDYAAVAALKRPVLEASFHWFRAHHNRHTRALADDFRDFRSRGGASLRSFAVFEALHERFSGKDQSFRWRDWPSPMRDPGSAEVAAFADAQAERVEFFEFLQWQADRQLGAAAATARAAGLTIGLYRDLAVGVDTNGAEAWADQEATAPGVSIGAPPDTLSRTGQNWGLAPINPLALRRRGYAPFVAALRANMRHAGILRIDHVMALQRLYWVPGDGPATRGAYVDYPLGDLLRLVALESQRQLCAVIGEDLGTVADGFRERMQAANVLSYRILNFERRPDGGFVPPSEYPPLAAAAAATHDLATLKGFWLGRDIAWRRTLGLYRDADVEAGEMHDRERDRHFLLEALEAEGLLARDRFTACFSAQDDPVYTPELGDAIHGFLAGARARLMLIQLEDVAGECEQANLPGTTDRHPNWRRRMSVTVDDLLGGAEMRRIAQFVNELRRQAALRA